MSVNQSPWIHHLGRTRPPARLTEPLTVDVAIIGAGIAGVTTAYYLLTTTKKHVLLIDADRVAHGATGHNAGQLVSYFERPFYDIADEFGLVLAAEGQVAIDSAWDLVEAIRADMHLETPCHVFTGYAGCVDMTELMEHLRSNALKRKAGIKAEMVFISDAFADRESIPSEFHGQYEVIAHEDLLNLLETKDRHYIAALAGKKGCMNSARFCEELVEGMLERFPERFRLAEHLPVTTVTLHEHHAVLETERFDLTAYRVILCTNGFERLNIVNTAGGDIDTKFHHLVRGSVGYMAAFIETPRRAPIAISYLPSHIHNPSGAYDTDPYYYITRRPYSAEEDPHPTDLICIGGPEALMDDTNHYSRSHPYPDEARKLIDAFLQRTYRRAGAHLEYAYFWHGLMGYTPNGLRCIGAEPCNPVLLYNLGCNGVGILPSVYGGSRIAQIVNGEEVGPSIFDPRDQRCDPPPPHLKKQRFWNAFFPWLNRNRLVQ